MKFGMGEALEEKTPCRKFKPAPQWDDCMGMLAKNRKLYIHTTVLGVVVKNKKAKPLGWVDILNSTRSLKKYFFVENKMAEPLRWVNFFIFCTIQLKSFFSMFSRLLIINLASVFA